MRIRTISISNFRSIESLDLDLSDYCALVGPNGSGKSAVLAALNVFFRESSNPTDVSALYEEDFHHRNTSRPVEITVTFTDLSPAAESDLSAYVRHGELTITARAEWDDRKQRAEVRQFGSRLVMGDFAPYFKAKSAGKKVAELRPIYQEIREAFPDLPDEKTGTAMEGALAEFESAHPELCTLKESPDEFYGFTRGTDRLAPHVQWVYIPAVKDASEEELEGRATALGHLLNRSIRAQVDFTDPVEELKRELAGKYQALIEANQAHLKGLSKTLQDRLREWAHPAVEVQLDWDYDSDKGVVVKEPFARARVGDGGFRGELARVGHGLQRSFVVALLTEVASGQADGQPTLILGFEEPELYQHPPQARHLVTVLEGLVEAGNQVVVTTHSPYFITSHGFESIRMTRKRAADGVTIITQCTTGELGARIGKALGDEPAPHSELVAWLAPVMQPSLNEMYFARIPILVEGQEDVAFVATYMRLRGLWGEFRRQGGHFVVCGGKTGISRPAAIAQTLGIRAFCLFDGDFNDAGKDEAKHRRDNSCLLTLFGHEGGDPWSSETQWFENLVVFARDLQKNVSSDVGADAWRAARDAGKVRIGVEGSLSEKNYLWIAAAVEELWDAGTKVDTLERLCDSILRYGA